MTDEAATIDEPMAASTDAAAFLRILHRPGDVCEIRIPKCPKWKGANKKVTVSGYFSDLDAAAKAAISVDKGNSPVGVYVTLNPVQKDLLARAANRLNFEAEHTSKDEHIIHRRHLLIDIDPKRLVGVSATNEEANAAIQLSHELRFELERCGWPEPLRCMSGNGAYLIYRIDLPNDAESTDLCQRVLNSLADRFSTDAASIDTTTFNASRILKICGTTARKGDATPDRPHRVAHFAPPSGELQVVSRELLVAEAEKGPPPKPATPAPVINRVNGDYSAFNRCDKYVAKMKPSISGDHGSDALLSVACVAFRFGLSRPEARTILDRYNATSCEPQWSDSDLEHKLDAGYDKVSAAGEFGKFLNNGHDQNGHASNGKPAEAATDGQQKAATEAAVKAAPLPDPIPIGELVETYPQLCDPVIHGLARRGEVVNVIAASKFGKSWLTYLIAFCVATGKRLFDRFLPIPGNVLIIDNELHSQTIAHRLPLVAKAIGLEPHEYRDRIHVISLRGQLADLRAIAAKLTAMERGRWQVIIIDAFYRTLPEGTDENSNAEITALYNLLDSIAATLECCIIVVHHASKGNQSLKAVTDVGAGAGAQSRAADTHVILRPHVEEGIAVMEAAVRSWPPVEPFCVRWDFPVWQIADNYDPKALKQPPGGKGKAPSPEKADKPSRLRINSRKVLDLMLANGPQTKTAIKNEINLSGTAVNEAIDWLLETGEIEPFEIEKSERKYDGFRAVQPNSRTDGTETGQSGSVREDRTSRLPFREDGSPCPGTESWSGLSESCPGQGDDAEQTSPSTPDGEWSEQECHAHAAGEKSGGPINPPKSLPPDSRLF